MPASASHYLLAKSIKPDIEQRGIVLSETAYFYGCQGPDFLLFHRAAPWQVGKGLAKLGSSLHRSDPDLPLELMRQYLNENQNNSNIKKFSLSYVLGYLTHYALDRTAHPFVYAFEKRIIETNNINYHRMFVHNTIESSLDVIMLGDKTNYDPAKIYLKDSSIIKKISDLMFFIIDTLYPNKATPSQIRQAFKDMRVNLKHLNDKSGKKKQLLTRLENIFHTGPALSSMIRSTVLSDKIDYANTKKANWHCPSNPNMIRNESYFEIFKMASNDSLYLIDGFLELLRGGNFSFLTDKLGFNTGAPFTQ